MSSAKLCRENVPLLRMVSAWGLIPPVGRGYRTPAPGLARGLTNYGDADFALYLRRSFATSMGHSKAMLARPVIGIAQSASGFNNLWIALRQAAGSRELLNQVTGGESFVYLEPLRYRDRIKYFACQTGDHPNLRAPDMVPDAVEISRRSSRCA